MESSRLFLIGPISPPATGPGIKNKLIIEELNKKNEYSFFTFNTLGKSKFNIFGLFNAIFKKSELILSVSTKGRYFLIPLAYIKMKLKLGNCVLLPAGGNFAKELSNFTPILKPFFLVMVKSFKRVCPETFLLEDELKEVGLRNIEVLPNPRKAGTFSSRKERELNKYTQLYFISSIKRSKGIIDCIEAVEKLNAKGTKVKLTIHGKVQGSFKDDFERVLKSSNHVEYRGMLDNSEVIKTLKNKADILLLPTYYFGEGLPGILVEAAFAGVPIIITKFKGIDAYFTDEENALFVEDRNPDDLAQKISRLINDKKLRNTIADNLLDTSKKFDVSTVTNRLIEILKS